MIKLNQSWPRPSTPMPIVIFGAGSIVKDAHIPAYLAAGFKIQGIFDPDLSKSQKLAGHYGFIAYETVEQAAGQSKVVFDIATPPDVHAKILDILPVGASVLIQKPMGSDLEAATNILQICRVRKLKAAVNFQLPRVEILLHSIHYMDFIRSLFGEPLGVHAKTLGHPNDSTSNTRTTAILDYGDVVRCALSINHNHSFGRKYQACEFRICGTKGAAYVQLGVNLDYPKGEPDILEINTGDGWKAVPLHGSWFTESFGNRMAQLQRFASGEEDTLISSVEDAWYTMALVEAAYESSAQPATQLMEKP